MLGAFPPGEYYLGVEEDDKFQRIHDSNLHPGTIGLCCGCESAALCSATVYADAANQGVIDMRQDGTCATLYSPPAYLVVNTFISQVGTDFNNYTTTGTLVFDQYNGTLVSHTVNLPTLPPGVAIQGNSVFPWPPNTNTGTDAQWTELVGPSPYQEITLSSGMTMADFKAIVADLLADIDVTMQPCPSSARRRWNYIEAAPNTLQGAFAAANLLIAVADNSGTPGVLIGTWQDPNNPSTYILDSAIPAHVAPVKVTDNPFATPADGALAAFTECLAVDWQSYKSMTRPVTPGSNHCIDDQLAFGGTVLSDTCSDITADGFGRIINNPPNLNRDGVHAFLTLNRILHINESTTGGSCPCH